MGLSPILHIKIGPFDPALGGQGFLGLACVQQMVCFDALDHLAKDLVAVVTVAASTA